MNEKADSFQALIDSITPEIHANLKTAVETGRWANGEKLSQAQLDHCLQAIIAYDARYLREEQRVGYIDKSGLKNAKGPAHQHEAGGACATETTPLTWSDPSTRSTH